MNDPISKASRQFGNLLFANPDMPPRGLREFLDIILETWCVEDARDGEVVKRGLQIAAERYEERISPELFAEIERFCSDTASASAEDFPKVWERLQELRAALNSGRAA